MARRGMCSIWMKLSVWKEVLSLYLHQWRMRPFGSHSWILAESKCSLACMFPICWWTNISIIKHEIRAPILRWKSEGGFAFITHTGISLRSLILISEILQNMYKSCCKPLCCWFPAQTLRTHSLRAHVNQHKDCAMPPLQHGDRWVTCFSKFYSIQKARLPCDTLPLRRH